MEAALQETPEVLHRVCVNVAIHVLYGMVDDEVLVVRLQAFVGFQFVAENRGTYFNPFPDGCLQSFICAAGDMPGHNLTAALYHAEGYLFILAARAGYLFGPLVFVHIPRLTTDERLIHFDFATKFVEGSILHGETDAMKHEPRSLLGDAKTTMDFITADSVFAVDDKPCGREPLFQRERGILEDCSGLQRECWFQVPDVAFPNARLGKPRNPFGTAFGALHHAVRPAQLDHELAAVLKIREVQDRVSEGSFAVHNSSVAEPEHNVKYIIALIWTAVIPKVLVTLSGENVQPGIAGVLVQKFDKLLRFSNRQHAQHQGVNEAEDRGIGADAEGQRE